MKGYSGRLEGTSTASSSSSSKFYGSSSMPALTGSTLSGPFLLLELDYSWFDNRSTNFAALFTNASTSATSSFFFLTIVLSRSVGFILSGRSKLKSSSLTSSRANGVTLAAGRASAFTLPVLLWLSPSSSFSSSSSIIDGVRSIACSSRSPSFLIDCRH